MVLGLRFTPCMFHSLAGSETSEKFARLEGGRACLTM